MMLPDPETLPPINASGVAAVSIREARTQDLPIVAEIYNHAVRTTVATVDLEERPPSYFEEWLKVHQDPVHTAVVAVCADGQVGAYGTLTKLTPRGGYRVSAEIGIYVGHDYKGQGLGGALCDWLIDHGHRHGLYTILGIATATNETSIRMIRNRGFVKSGEMNAVAEKFGQILDLHVYQLRLRSPQFVENTVRGAGENAATANV